MGNSASNRGNQIVSGGRPLDRNLKTQGGAKKPDVSNAGPGEGNAQNPFAGPPSSLGGGPLNGLTMPSLGGGLNPGGQFNPFNPNPGNPGVVGAVPSAQGGIRPDADGRGFTNPDGGHDWNVGQGPGGNFGGQVNRTGQAMIGPEVQSGDSLGYARGSQQYRDATAARQAWIQQNLSGGRTLADLGLEPTRGGGLANFMSLGSTLIPGMPGLGNPREIGAGPVGLNDPGTRQRTPTDISNPGMVNNQLTAQRRQKPMGSLGGVMQTPMRTSRFGG